MENQHFKLPKNEYILESDYTRIGLDFPDYLITKNRITGKYQLYKVEDDMTLTLKSKSDIPVFNYNQWK